MMINKIYKVTFLLFYFPFYCLAQQGGDYTSTVVQARTWMKKDGKVSFSDWKPFETRLVNQFKDFKPAEKADFNKYGSRNLVKLKATGFFRVEKIKDRWWVVDPEGYTGLHIGVNSINVGKSVGNKSAFADKFSSKEDWMQKTKDQIINLGFNGSGSWSDHEAIIKANKNSKDPVSYSINWNFMSAYGKKRGGTYSLPGHTGYPGNVIFLFDPEFEDFCMEHAKRLIPYKNDPHLFGHFSDNEMPFSLKNLDGYLKLDQKDPGYVAAKKWLDDKKLSPEQLTDADRAAFLAFAAEKYFSIVSKAIKQFDPNHLYLGSRFYSGEKNVPAFMKAAGKYLDVISINYYGTWTPNVQAMENWTAWSGKPFIITEFYTKGVDSGLPNMSGAGWIVNTQEDRGKFYQNYCLALLEAKNCVGWHWFKYQDNDPNQANAEKSNTDANKGLVTNNFELYSPLADLMKQLNLNRYRLIDYFDKN